MNYIQHIFLNSSTYEINMEIILYSLILCTSFVAIYWSTRSKRILILSICSFVLLFLLNILGIFVIDTVFNIHISEIFRIVPVISSTLLVSNLGILIGFYISKSHSKGFRISSIRKEYLSDSVKQTVFLLLLGISTVFFLSPHTEAIVSISILSTVSVIWCTYWISKYILK